ncbi:hypothetical protein [Nostoc sp.]|uniref:hypothetical protein n=1 Tax=Nostoc sp. TaxID=1180 RepID=UPI002FFB0130
MYGEAVVSIGLGIVMRADRLLSILMLLQVYRQLTARDLAERLEVLSAPSIVTRQCLVFRCLGRVRGALLPDFTSAGCYAYGFPLCSSG